MSASLVAFLCVEEPSRRVQEADPGAACCRPGGGFSSPLVMFFLLTACGEKKISILLFLLFSL